MSVEEQLKDIADLLQELLNVFVKKCPYTFSQWVDEWLSLYKIGQIKDSTMYQLRLNLKHYMLPTLADINLGDIDTRILQQLVNDISAPRQKEHIYCTLKDIFSKATNLLYIPNNPMLAVIRPQHDKKHSVSLSLEQQKRLIRACEHSKYCNYFMIILYSGLRRGEALALTYADIDLENHVLHITKSVDDFGNVTTPKTKASIRDVLYLNRFCHMSKNTRILALNAYLKFQQLVSMFISSTYLTKQICLIKA